MIMLENTGIILKVDLKNQQLLVNDRWLVVGSDLNITKEWLGKSIKYQLDGDGSIKQLALGEQKLKKIKGKIQSMNLEVPRISMHMDEKLIHFYLTEKDYEFVKRDLQAGIWIQFLVHEEQVIINAQPYYVIAMFNAEKSLLNIEDEELRSKLELLLNAPYCAFLDLEFSMTGYEYYGKEFAPEIVQAGLIVTNTEGHIIEKFSSYVRPTAFLNLTNKTQEFLKVNAATIHNGMSYAQFYDAMNRIITRYDPLFVVWGCADGFVLRKSCKLNEKKRLIKKDKLLDLQRIHGRYYAISQDIGLYNASKSYGISPGIQIHDALVDALVLHQIFLKFKENIDGELVCPFKENYHNILEIRKNIGDPV